MNVAYYFSVGTSSESEEEIVFQRKNRKKNVLKSPDVSLNRENKRQEKQKSKKVKHQTKNPLCMYSYFCLHRLRMIVILNHRFMPSENVDTRLTWLVRALVMKKENNMNLFMEDIFKHSLFFQVVGKCSY